MKRLFILILSYVPVVTAEENCYVHSKRFNINTVYHLPLHRVDCHRDNAKEFTLTGRMLGHSHGMPTLPTIKFDVSTSKCIAYGVSFSMKGEWILDLKRNGESKIKKNVIVE